MSLFNIFEIAGSGLSAQTTRLNVTASNISNAQSQATRPEDAYKARNPVFAAALQDQFQANKESVGVRVLGVVENNTDHPVRFEPGNPLANEDGYVFMSNVNVMEEMTNMMSASSTYQNNIEVINTSKELMLQTLRLGQ